MSKPSAEANILNMLAFNKDGKSEPTCEELYGPYPRAIPVPAVSKDGSSVVDEKEVEGAKSWRDFSGKYTDHRDVGTPDAWVPRDGRLVRLTGRHPFNVEPPISVLNEFKFITPSSLHYVRNHGACPQLEWATHKMSIGGKKEFVPRPFEIGMDELAAMKARELPVTLVCAGNRRKEQNMIRQTIGFNWGPSGVATNVWKGVLLRDLLLKAGVSERDMADKHVEFIGIEDLPNKVGPGPFPEEPWGKLVKYGTSIPLARAMNPMYDVLIAYEANGERLQPDHGFPVRLIIPGYIGGRMIKWLKEINVLEHETRNHYHYHDNRILPPHITAEQSLEGNWWYKPEYIFNELNINSAIARPDHAEELKVAENIRSNYEMEGYAYTGGGRKISRVEISTNGGVNWNLAEIHRKEKPTSYGMYWCWIWWTYSLPVVNLIGCKELWVRAWDESNNPQPVNPTWNLMGMGNNQVFRVKVHMDMAANGAKVFRFEHPTQPGQLQGGWMTTVAGKPDSAGFGRLLVVQGEQVAKAAESAPAPKPPAPAAVGKKVVSSTIAKPATTSRALPAASPEPAAPPAPAAETSQSADGKKLFTMAEIEKHNKEEDVWIIVKNRVYDCTEYLELHPGGVESIVINGGADATEDFVAIHSIKATKMLEKYYIGDVDLSSVGAAATTLDGDAGEEKKSDDAGDYLTDHRGNPLALNPKKKVQFRLRGKTVLSHDSFLLDFELPTPKHVLGLPTGKHMFISAKIDGDTVMRRYTPISSNYDVGCVKFVIKAYRPCARFPRGGKMSQYLDEITVGDMVDFKGPIGEFEYLGNGRFLVDGQEMSCNRFNMIAGGTGITPVVQVAADVLRHPNDKTQMTLIFACREENDLLLRYTLDEWAAKFPDKFRVHYILSDRWPQDWKHSTGFVSKPLFEEHLFPASPDVYTLMCGPPIMLDKGCTPNLKSLGHDDDRVFAF